jgi:small subunit ribosomal protein S16
MATRIRLARRGRKRKPVYDIIVADSRAKRDGRFIEKLGTFNPNRDPGSILLEEDRALYWVMVGAEPSDTVKKLLSRAGVMLRKHLQVGVNKGAITQEVADERYKQWLAERTSTLGTAPFTSKNAVSGIKEEAAVINNHFVTETVAAVEEVVEEVVEAVTAAVEEVVEAVTPEETAPAAEEGDSTKEA